MKQFWITTLALVLIGACGDTSGEPRASGTNTSWLKSCTRSLDCGGEGDCLCGLCTRSCQGDESCGSGVCGSQLASYAQCETEGSERICLPKGQGADGCTELLVSSDLELSASQPVACETPGALLCESFDAPLPMEYSTWYYGEPIASVSDCRVAAGTGAMQYSADTFAYAQTRIRLPEPLIAGPLYVRFYAYLSAQVAIGSYLGLFELWTEDDSAEQKIGLELIDGDRIETYVAPGDVILPSEAAAFQRDAWQCIELALELSDSNGSVSISVNGETVVARSNIVTVATTPYVVAVIEGLPSDDVQSLDLTLDELVIATQPIGCE